MFNNPALDVFIGLVFVFLLYSLLATIFLEFYASLFALRAKLLQKAIRRMLMDGLGMGNNLWYDFLHWLTAPVRRFFPSNFPDDSVYARFYNHPSIKYLGEGRVFRRPSYLHGHNFSQVMLDLLRGDTYDGRTENESELIRLSLENNTLNLPAETLKQLRMLFAVARQDSQQFKHKLEDWFEEMMERTTGWYKRQSQILLLLIGFCLAWSFNVDAIAIAQILIKDDDARAKIVDMAIARQKEYGAILDSVTITTVRKKEVVNGDTTAAYTDSTIETNGNNEFPDAIRNRLEQDAWTVQGILGLKGIPSTADSSSCDTLIAYIDSAIAREKNTERKKWLQKEREKIHAGCLKDIATKSPYQGDWWLAGWLITALAVSLGAPFWFDLLNKVIKLRATGPQVANTAVIDKPAGARDIAAGSVVKDNNGNDIKG